MSDQEDKVRLDKWLWAARFYKTRSMAADAADGDRVLVNGVRGKPARAVKPGDELSIRIGPLEYVVRVLGLSGRRGPAAQAQKLYAETDASKTAREALQAQLRAMAHPDSRWKGRPTKKQRRHLGLVKGDPS